MPNKKKLYQALKAEGYDNFADESAFNAYVDNADNRKKLFSALKAEGYDNFADEKSFDEYLGYSINQPEDDTVFEANAERFRNGQPTEKVTTQSVIDAHPELGLQQPIVEPYSAGRASLKEQVDNNNRKFPKIEDLPWAKPLGGTDGRVHTTDLAERLNRTYLDGGMESFLHSEEDEKVKTQYTPREEKTAADVWGNAMNKFALTERGGQLQSELAQIQDEITNKYLDEFKNSDEYRQFLGKKFTSKDEENKANKALTDLFNAKYSEAIYNDMQPYMQAYNNEVMHRYGVDVETGLNNIAKKEAAETLGNLSTSVNADLEDIEDAITSRQKAVRNMDWKPGMPSSRDDAKLAELRGQRTYLEGAKELIEDSQNILNAVEAEKDGSFFGGLGRGIRDKAFDIDTWTIGLSDLVGGLRLKSVLEKAEKGETLTPAEQKLLDASVNNMAVNFYYRNDLGLGYQAGEITGQSIPFMLEFLVNPVSASGNAMAKRLLTYGLKRFGSAVNSKAIKAGTRLATDALAAGGVTVTTGMGHVLSGGVERLNKNYEYGLDEEGNLNVVNTHNMGVGEAFAKSATSAFLERQSEMIFNAFRGAPSLFKGIEASLPGGVNTFMNYISNSRLGELWRGIKNNATMKELAKRTQFHGLGEEYLEEVYNNFANIPLGEMTYEEATDLEKNIVTFLGLAPTQVMFSAIGGIGYGVERYKAKRDLERTFGKMTEEQKRKLMELQEMGKLSTNKDIAFFLAETIKDESLTPEQKRAEIEYAYNLAKQNAIDEVSNTDVEDTIESENVAIDAVANLATGEYIEVDRWVVDGETGVRVPQPGYIVGWIGEAPVFVPEGMENAEENRIVLKPNEWNPETVQRMPAEEVKALNEEMIREEAARQAEREAKYAPEVLSQEMQQGIPFETEDAIYVPISPMLEGNGWVVEVQPKGVDNKAAARPFTEELTNDQFHDMLQAQLDAQESAQAEAAKVEESNQSIVEGLEAKPMEDGTGRVMQPKGVQGNEVVYDITDGNGTVLEEGSMDAAEYNGVGESAGEQVNAGVKPQTPIIPTKEDGSIDFVSYGKEGTFKALGEKYGEKMPNKVAVTAKALADDLAKAQKKLDKAIEDYDNAPIGREDKAEKARDKAQQEFDAIKREADFWAEMDTEIKDAQFRRASMLNPQAETETSSEPMNADEFVAQQLSAGNIVLNKEDYKRETGYGDAEANAMNGGAAKMFGENGMTIQEAGERLMEMDRENGTNFFDQSDSNAGRDALISLLGSVKSRKELNQYIASNRAEQAKKESEGLRNELERSVMDANYASLEDYVLQMEANEVENPFSDVNADEILAIFAEAVEEYNNYLNPQENGQGTTEESIEGNGELLSEEQSSDTGGTEVRQESARNGEGAAEESKTADAEQQVILGEAADNEVESYRNKVHSWLSDENLEAASEMTRDETLEKFGNTPEPIAYIPMKYLSIFGEDVTDNRLYCGKGYFIDHAVNHHPEVKVEEYDLLQDVLSNPDAIKHVGNSIAFTKMHKKGFAVLVQLSNERGKIILHKSMFWRDKGMPYKNKQDVEVKPLVGGRFTISPNDNSIAGRLLSALNGNTNIANYIIPQKELDEILSDFSKNGIEISVSDNNNGDVLNVSLQMKEGETPLQFAERAAKENERRAPLRKRVKEWEKLLGVKVNVIENPGGVRNKEALRYIAKGKNPSGWVESNGEVAIYLPGVSNVDEVDKTIIHEVVAHKGLPGLLGKERFDELCDKVWDMMSEAKRAEYYDYVGDRFGSKEERQRAAADEYMAFLSEEVGLSLEEKTIWDNIVKMFRELLDKALNGIISKSKMTDADIAELIKASYANLKSGADGRNDKRESGEDELVNSTRFRTTKDEQSIIDKAKADGTYMLAPNGEPTNLTEKQWAQVRTEAFKKWFGDWEKNPKKSSLMIDENGEPKVYYHGSPSRFNEFISDKMGETGTGYGQGFYFSPEKWFAEGYVGENGGTLYEVFLNLRKPISDTKKTLNKPSIKRFIDEIDKRMMKRNDDGIGILDNWDDVSYYGRNKVLNEATEAVFEYNETDLEIVGDLINTSGSYDIVTEVLRDILGFDGVLPSNTNNEVIVHHPNQIKSATDNVGTFDEGNNDIRFRFIGERGARNLDKAEEATTRLDNLAVAREMEAAEKNAKTIKMATGWERGADGLWRYEVDDNIDFELRRPKRAELKKAYEEANEKYYKLEMRIPTRTPKSATEEEKQRIKELRKELAKLRKGMNKAFDAYYDYSAERATLGEFLGKDNQLFKEYPELADYDVSFLRDSKKLAEGLKGSFTPEYKVIWVDDARPKGDIKSTLVHEIQHAIQGIEGFSQGGTPAAFASAKYQAEEWKTNFNEFINRYGFEDWSKNLPIEDWMKYGKEYKGQFGGLHRAFIDNAVEDEDVKKTLTKELDYVKAAYDKFYQIAGGMDPAYKFKNANEWYRSLSGEVESRNVQQRMGMTDEQRRNTLAESTEDVAREDQVFLKDGIESGETRFRSVNEPAVDYVSQANDVVEVPRDEVMYTMNNIANQLYKTSGRFMRQLYKYGTLGRVLKGEYAEIDQIKAKNEYDHAKPILEEYLNELVWMKYQATEAAQEVINDVISDVEYAMQYYKDLSLGKDVWRTQSSPRFRISEKGKQIQAEVDKFTSKYNSKPVVLVDSEMTDEELEEAVPESSANRTREEISSGYPGGYSRDTDKIYIFVDNQELGDLGTTMFHENLHPMYNGSSMVEELYNNAKEDKKALIEALSEAYEESEMPNEMFAHMIAKDMFRGDFKFAEKYLSEESRNELFNTLKEFGYDRVEEESIRRRQGNLRSDITLDKEPQTSEQVDGRLQERKAVSPRERKERLGKLFDQVADMGLEGVLENKAYTSMMVDIYKALPEAVRTEIADDAIRLYGGSVAPAVSDYIGVKSKESIIDKIVTIVREALRKIGFDLDLNANEVRYLAWRSKKPLDRRNLLEVAEDIDMKNRLKVGEYDGTTPDGGGTRFRVANKLQVRDEYEATIKKGGYQAREAVQDAMLSLRKFQELIEKASGKKIRDFENAWMHENRLSSVVQAEIHDMERKFYKPMMDAVKKLMNAANLEQEEVADYLMLKHGIERNREMAVRKALTDDQGKIDRTQLEQWYQEKQNIRNDASLDTWRKKQEAMDNLALMYGADMSRDYSGLTSMFGTDDLADSTQKAYDEVEALENSHPVETESLGKAIKAMTQNALDKSFESGLMDRKVYDELSKDMYDYYIPLRGFEETTSEEVYAYLDQDRGAFNAPLVRAKGRSSKSDNPIAYLKSIAESGIMQGNRNKMKQSFLNMVMNNPSDLVSVREGVWAIFNPASGEWEAATPPAIPNNATPADVEAAMEAWEQQMEAAALSDPTLVKKVSEAADVPYRVVGNRMNQHQVIVKRLGKSYTLTINGNPRLAMALNGQTNPNNTSNDGKVAAYVSGKIDALNRTLSAWYTTRNPDFVASNFMRDTFYTNTIVRAKEGNAYANKFHKNYAKLLKPGKMINLFRKYENGTLDVSNKTEAAFLDFMMNGGETGYSNLKDLEHIKKQIAKELKGNKLAKIEKVAEKLDILNRAVENTARFAAYLTSRQEGRSIAKSIFDAKEISVNFNKKGAGGTFFGMTGQTKLGNLGAMVGAGGRAFYVFFNAAIQGTTNLMHVMKVNPKGTSAGVAAMFLMGAVVPMLFAGDDDEKDYYDLPEHVRRNHLIIPGTGDAWVSIPLPIEYRIMYGMGELLTSWRTGHERGSDIARKMLNLTGQALPLNFLEEGFDAFIPSALSPIWQVYNNKSWTGLPIYKDTEFNKDDPEYTKAYKNVDRLLYNFSKSMYEWTFDEENQKARVDLNPAVMEALARGYFGGLATQLSNLGKTWETIAGEREFDWRSIPIGNRVFKSGDERTKEKRITNEYFENMEKLEFLQARERLLKKTINGVEVPEMDKEKAKIDDETMRGSEVYQKYMEFKKLKKTVDKIRKTIKEKGSTPELEKALSKAQEEANKAVR